MEYRTFYKEGDITCEISNNVIEETQYLDITSCRKRCDDRKECKFFFYSYFSEQNPCQLFRSCHKFEALKQTVGTTYAKIRRSMNC